MRPRTVIALIFVVALTARLAAAVVLGLPYGDRPADLDGLRSISGAADEISYGTLAARLATGHGLTFPVNWYPWIHADAPQTYFSTATAVLYSSVYAVTGVHPFAARILTATLGALAVIALYALGVRLFGKRVALTAAVIAALYAYLVFYSTRLVTETPFTLAVLCALLVAYAARERPTVPLAVALGIAVGAAVLFRLAILFYVPVLLLWVWLGIRRTEGGSWLKWLALPTVIVALMLAPLTVRNYRLWGRLVLSETQFGHVFWNGNHPDHRGSFHPFEVFPIPPEVLAIGNEAVMTSELLKRGAANVLADPATFFNLTGDRLIEMYRFWPSRSSTPVANSLRVLSFGWVFPLALAGMWLTRRRWRDLIPIYALIVVHTAVYAISWSMIRYRVPLDPYFILFAAVTVVAAWEWLGGRMKTGAPNVRTALLGLSAILPLAGACASQVPSTDDGSVPMQAATAGVTAGPVSTDEPYPPPPSPTPVDPPANSLAARVGVQVFEADVDTPALAKLQEAGVQWARTRVLWKLVEPADTSPPTYDWSVTDRFFTEVADHGMRNISTVYANPAWVTERECLPVPSELLPRWSAFVQALVERYDGDGASDAPGSPRVEWWEVGNEPDFDPTAAGGEADYGSCAGNDPAAFAAQHLAAYEAGRRADPTARVVLGAVAYDRFTADSAPEGWTAAAGPFQQLFTQELLESLGVVDFEEGGSSTRGARFFDAVSFHHYNDNADYWSPFSRSGLSDIEGHAALFNAHQLADLGAFVPDDTDDNITVPGLLTETGLAAGPSDEWTIRNEELQAWYLPQAVLRSLASGLDLVIWYTARDNLMGDCQAPHYDWLTFGLMRSTTYADAVRACPELAEAMAYPIEDDSAPRPAYAALTTLLAVLGRAELVLDYEHEVGGFWGEAVVPTLEALDRPPEVEAYETWVDDRRIVAAWTSTGQRLGARDTEPVTSTLTLEGSGAVVTTHLGETTTLSGEDGFVRVPVGPAPVYIEAQP